MFDKTENNYTEITPCSIDGLVSVTDLKEKTHIIQRELISYTEEDQVGWYHSDGKTPTTIVNFINDTYIRVSLSAAELAIKLGIKSNG